MRRSGVQATEVGDMQLCIDSKTNSGVDDISSPVDVDGVDNVNKVQILPFMPHKF